MQRRFIDRVHSALSPVVNARLFDWVSGATSFLNPLALLPQLWLVIKQQNVEAISVAMWVVFVVIQGTFLLVGVKSRNTGVFVSMLLSMLISLSVILVVVYKT